MRKVYVLVREVEHCDCRTCCDPAMDSSVLGVFTPLQAACAASHEYSPAHRAALWNPAKPRSGEAAAWAGVISIDGELIRSPWLDRLYIKEYDLQGPAWTSLEPRELSQA